MTTLDVRGTTRRMTHLRRVIAARMLHSQQVSAQLTTVVEADLQSAADLRRQWNSTLTHGGHKKVGYFPIIAKAAIGALEDHPVLNASINDADSTVTYHDTEHVAIAVDTDRGLLVPVIRDANRFDVYGLAREIDTIAGRARASELGPADLQGGTFTLTNTGSRGALFDTPIINQPQVAILGVGLVVNRPVAVDVPDRSTPEITVHPMVHLSLTYDHRLIDGSDAARYLTDVRRRLEDPAPWCRLGTLE